MSVDGFSMASLGLPKDITSAQAAVSAEQGIFTGNEKVVGKIDRALNKKINNEEKEQQKKNSYFNDGYKENDNDDEDDDENRDSESEILDKDEKISSNNAKQYKALLIKDPENVEIRINKYSDRIELFNKVTNKTLESINAKDFLEMMNRLDYNSGVMINKSI